jgi:quinol monooxygenase YgiN
MKLSLAGRSPCYESPPNALSAAGATTETAGEWLCRRMLGSIEMILVTGSILAHEHCFDEVLRSCLEHVERSRKEPGCVSHDVHVDCQNPMRLFFFEQWADEAALRTHFAVEGSQAFVKSLKGRIVETSGTKIYQACSIPR